MGLDAAQGRALALATLPAPPNWRGSRTSRLRCCASASPQGGTTYAALTSMEADGVKAALVKAVRASWAQWRAKGNWASRLISG